MKVLVSAKHVIDYRSQVRVRKDRTGVETHGVAMSMNPFDEIALEAAIRLKEQGIASEVLLVSIGNQDCQKLLRTGLAMGADRALLIETDVVVQPLSVARLLQAVVQEEHPRLVLLGKQAIDDDASQVGPMLSALLRWPQACFASTISLDTRADTAEITCEVDAGLQTVLLNLPAIITVDLTLHTPRYIGLPNIMSAAQKTITSIAATDYALDIRPHYTVTQVTPPAPRAPGVFLESLEELCEKIAHYQEPI